MAQQEETGATPMNEDVVPSIEFSCGVEEMGPKHAKTVRTPGSAVGSELRALATPKVKGQRSDHFAMAR